MGDPVIQQKKDDSAKPEATLPKSSFQSLRSKSVRFPSFSKLIQSRSEQEERKDIPKNIQEKAAEERVLLKDIKRIGDNWMGCTDGRCIDLGKVEAKDKASAVDHSAEQKKEALAEQLKALPVGSKISVSDAVPGARSEFALTQSEVSMGGDKFSIGGFGSFSKNSDGTYSFTKSAELVGEISVLVPEQEADTAIEMKSMAEARAYISEHPEQGIAVLGTVPELCPPCRQLEGVLPGAVKDLRGEGTDVKVIKLTYNTFDEAKADFGQHAKFPIMGLFAPGDRRQTVGDSNVERGPILKSLGGLREVVVGVKSDLRDRLRRIAPQRN